MAGSRSLTSKSCDGLCVAEEEFEDTSPVPAQCVVIDPLHGRESDYVSCTKRSGKEAIAASVVTVVLCRFGGDKVYTWANGDTYSGHLEAGRRTGWGVVTCPGRGKVQIVDI